MADCKSAGDLGRCRVASISVVGATKDATSRFFSTPASSDATHMRSNVVYPDHLSCGGWHGQAPVSATGASGFHKAMEHLAQPASQLLNC